MIFAKLTLHVTDADTSEKADASPISELTSLISEIPSSADFYRGTHDVQSTLEFMLVKTPFLHFYDLDLSDLFFL